MRSVYSAFVVLLALCAAPAMGAAQVLLPFEGKPWPTYNERLDRAVPVATVSHVGDMFAFAGARVVDDGHGEPFVLGAASLDLRDPAHAKVVLTMTNVTGVPILFTDVMIHEVLLCATGDRQRPFAFPQVGGRPADGIYDPREFQPGETVTIQIPIPPSCPARSEPLSILVRVGRPSPAEWSSTPTLRANTHLSVNKELFLRVFARWRAEATSSQRRHVSF
jgi:hypothetical protein